MSQPIESYGFIGNMVSGALVGRDGSIDWLCLPRFDLDAFIAALLGTPDHGRWLIAPHGETKRTQRRYSARHRHPRDHLRDRRRRGSAD